MLPRFLLFALLCTIACRTDGTKTDSGREADTVDHAAIRTKLYRYYDDMSRRDWKAYRTSFWDNATITTIWQQPGESASTVDVTTINDFILETPKWP